MRALVIVGSSLLAPAILAATPAARPGQWETTVQMEMPGMPVALPPMVSSSCVTEKDLVPQTAQPGQDCKVLEQKLTGKTVEWSVQCKDKSGAVSTMNGKGTYDADTFKGTMQMSMTQDGRPMQMNAKVSSKRVGDCKKPTP